MAFRSTAKRKEVKKSSYYVWFLGAKESRGLRGDAFIRPGLRYLVEREREVEPMKVTLQVSNKGLKIVQNVCPPPGGNGGRGYQQSNKHGAGGQRNGIFFSSSSAINNAKSCETIKHFIPHDAITCVIQGEPPDDDLVACILLLYNPVTRCPVHIHAYRCDSVETAALLRRQLEALTEHPDTQRKMAELESRMETRGASHQHLLEPHRQQLGGSDGRSTRGDSESSGSERGSSEIAPSSAAAMRQGHQGYGVQSMMAQNQPLDERTAHLYASLAAELREKLKGGKSEVPILLPPRDYDTVHRNRGRLDGIEGRKSMQVSVVGPNGLFQRRIRSSDHPKDDSSGKSSGIGSDEAPSSPPRGRRSSRDPDAASSSEEEWEAQRQLQARAAREMLHWEPPGPDDPPKRSSRTSDHRGNSNSSRGGHQQQQQQQQQQQWQPPQRHEPTMPPYRVLPRISPKSPTRPVYHELPEEKRYPGLDRDSARVHYLERDGRSPTRVMEHQRAEYRMVGALERDGRDNRPTHLPPQRFSYTEPPNGYLYPPERRRIGMASQDF